HTTHTYTLSLHDALPISSRYLAMRSEIVPKFPIFFLLFEKLRSANDTKIFAQGCCLKINRVIVIFVGIKLPTNRREKPFSQVQQDRKSTRLNSSHVSISY